MNAKQEHFKFTVEVEDNDKLDKIGQILSIR